MRIIFAILLCFPMVAFAQSDSTIKIVKNTVTLPIPDTVVLTIVPHTADTIATDYYKKGSVTYTSSSPSVVQVSENWLNERQCNVVPLKVGRSTIEIRLTQVDGTVLTGSLTVVVTSAEEKEATGFIMTITDTERLLIKTKK